MNEIDRQVQKISESYCDICKYLQLKRITKVTCGVCHEKHQICDNCSPVSDADCPAKKIIKTIKSNTNVTSNFM